MNERASNLISPIPTPKNMAKTKTTKKINRLSKEPIPSTRRKRHVGSVRALRYILGIRCE
jgi:hypothetical protein